MATVYRPIAQNPYEQFRYDLSRESPRASYWLESVLYGILAQVDGMTEETALELACKIILLDPETKKATERDSKRF